MWTVDPNSHASLWTHGYRYNSVSEFPYCPCLPHLYWRAKCHFIVLMDWERHLKAFLKDMKSCVWLWHCIPTKEPFLYHWFDSFWYLGENLSIIEGTHCHLHYLRFQMEEEEHTDRKQQLAMLYQKLNKIKKSLNEGNIRISNSIYWCVHTVCLCFIIMKLYICYRWHWQY